MMINISLLYLNPLGKSNQLIVLYALKYISSERKKIQEETEAAQEDARKKAEEESKGICTKAQQNFDKAVEAVLEEIK